MSCQKLTPMPGKNGLLAPRRSALATRKMVDAFADFLSIDVGAGDAADDTLRTYRQQIQLFLTWCEDNQIHPGRVMREDIKRYRRFLSEDKKYKPATVALKLSVLRRFYDAAMEHGLMEV